MITFEAFFGFTGIPFSRDIPIDKLLETSSSKELHGRLNYVARTRAFGVFTGDAGTGKTTATRSRRLIPNAFSSRTLCSTNTLSRPCVSGGAASARIAGKVEATSAIRFISVKVSIS